MELDILLASGSSKGKLATSKFSAFNRVFDALGSADCIANMRDLNHFCKLNFPEVPEGLIPLTNKIQGFRADRSKLL